MFSITDAAEARIRALAKDGKLFRIGVRGGGCAGFEYEFSLTETRNLDDTFFGSAVVIDALSLPFLLGATLDFVETLTEAKFVIKNPNAKSACGCGSSFAENL